MDRFTKRRPELAGKGRYNVSVAFVAFILVHVGCTDEVVESRLDEDLVACWCPRCDDLRIFGAAKAGA